MKSEIRNQLDMNLVENVLEMLNDLAADEDQSDLFCDLFWQTFVALGISRDPQKVEIFPRLMAIRDYHAQIMVAAYKREAPAILFAEAKGNA